MRTEEIRIYDLIFKGMNRKSPNKFIQIAVASKERKLELIKEKLKELNDSGNYTLASSKRNEAAEKYYNENPDELLNA